MEYVPNFQNLCSTLDGIQFLAVSMWQSLLTQLLLRGFLEWFNVSLNDL